MTAASTSSPHRALRIGVIAEDQTDTDTLKILLKRLRGSQTQVSARQGGGGGEIFRKGERWMKDLARDACTALVIVHDLDKHTEHSLRSRIEKITVPDRMQRCVCIPVQELEAWFWADAKVLQKVARKPIPADASPEKRSDPKESLMRISRDGGSKPRYATTENPRLAEDLDLELCAKHCPSFSQLRDFIISL